MINKKEREPLQNIIAYQIDFTNKGGLVMPIILEFTFEDGSKLNDKIPAQVWRHDEKNVSKTYYFDKKLKSIQLDPLKETADIDTSNNFWSSEKITSENTSKFQVFKERQQRARGAAAGMVSPMQAAGKKN